jgi:flagellin-specific chaperone FliS
MIPVRYLSYSLLATVLSIPLAAGPVHAQNVLPVAFEEEAVPDAQNNTSGMMESQNTQPESGGMNAANEQAVNNPRLAAQRFIGHLNGAKLALSLHESETARANLVKAQDMLSILKSTLAEGQTFDHMAFGRVYYGDPSMEGVYVPMDNGEIETGPVKVKTVSEQNSLWRRKEGVAISNAEIAYITLALQDTRPERTLADAMAALHRKDEKEALNLINDLFKDVVKIESAVPQPIDKARDNILLARNFIVNNHFDAARYALGHANDALEELEKDDRFEKAKSHLKTVREEIIILNEAAEKEDATIAVKAQNRLDKIWQDLQLLASS